MITSTTSAIVIPTDNRTLSQINIRSLSNG
jgi:hypothetical protein